jgi:hypothetical protein
MQTCAAAELNPAAAFSIATLLVSINIAIVDRAARVLS